MLRFYDTGDSPHYKWVFLELALGGDLFSLIETNGVEEDIAHFYFRQLINGVDFLHSRGVAHRDIKPENLLLDANGNLKIADFGLAALFRLPDSGARRQCHTACGSPPYIAPEIFSGTYDPDSADIWSCGIVLFVLLCGQTPWDEPTRLDLDFKEFVSKDGKVDRMPWNTLPLEALSLLRCIIKVDVSQRFKIADVRLHPWFTRKNPFLADGSSEVCNDPKALATKLLSNLQVDLSDENFAATQQAVKAMSSTLPITTTATSLPSVPAFSSQQQPKAENISEKEKAFLQVLAQDPMQLQFKKPGTPIPLSLSQKDVNFKDMFYQRVVTTFYSLMPLETIVPMLGSAFHQLGVSLPVRRDPMAYSSIKTAILPVKMYDRRRIPLRGVMQCSKVSSSSQFFEVSFVRSIGDQVEWRHVFKKVVLLCRDAVFIDDRQ